MSNVRSPLSRLGHRNVISVLGGVVALYFAVAIYGLHFEISRLLFPRSSIFAGPAAESTASIKAASGNELLIRRFGEAHVGCVVFFPGQHGASAAYDFPSYVAAGLATYVVAYPGQDGASGRTDLNEIESLVGRGLAEVGSTCLPSRTVLVGVSLGAMLAAYAAGPAHVAGLVLSSTAPSLSSALRTRLSSSWALAPLSLLPLSDLLPRDYSLKDGLGQSPGVRVAIFQGTKDEQTPLELLRGPGMPANDVKLATVPSGTHSTTFAMSKGEQLATILDMLRRRGP